MKKLYLSILLPFVILSAAVFQACCGDTGFYVNYYMVDDIDSIIGQTDVYNENQTEVKRGKIGIRISPVLSTYFAQNYHSSIISSSYACEESYKEEYGQQIQIIEILSIEYLEIKNVTNSFLVADWTTNLYSPIESKLPTQNHPSLYLIYKESPEIDSIAFIIHAGLTDGRVVTDTTQFVKLL